MSGKASCACSTSGKSKFSNPQKNLLDQLSLPINEWQTEITNDFETSVFLEHPEIAKIKSELIEKGAVYATMTGSGSAVFGLFEKEPKLEVGHGQQVFVGSLDSRSS